MASGDGDAGYVPLFRVGSKIGAGFLEFYVYLWRKFKTIFVGDG